MSLGQVSASCPDLKSPAPLSCLPPAVRQSHGVQSPAHSVTLNKSFPLNARLPENETEALSSRKPQTVADGATSVLSD